MNPGPKPGIPYKDAQFNKDGTPRKKNGRKAGTKVGVDFKKYNQPPDIVEVKSLAPGGGHAGTPSKVTPLTLLSYHEVQKAMAAMLLEKGESIATIEAITGLGSRAIQAIRNKESQVSDVLYETLKAVEAKKLHFLNHKIIDSIDQDTIDHASLAQRSIAYGTLFDKQRLLEGKPTNINSEFTGKADEELEKEIVELEKQLDGSYTANEEGTQTVEPGND